MANKKCTDLLKRYEDNLTYLIESEGKLKDRLRRKQFKNALLEKQIDRLYAKKYKLSGQLEDKCPNAAW